MLQKVIDEYQQHQLDLIVELGQLQATGMTLSAEHVAVGLEPDNDNSLIKEWVKRNTRITPRELAAALNVERIKNLLGFVPRDATQFIETFVKENGMAVRFDGGLVRKPKPFMLDPKGKQMPILWKTRRTITLRSSRK